MNKTTTKPRLQLKQTTVRVLTRREVKDVVGALRRTGDCCDSNTQLLNPFTK